MFASVVDNRGNTKSHFPTIAIFTHKKNKQFFLQITGC